MTEMQLSPTAQKVLNVLRQNPGVAHSPTDVCEVADCSTGEAQVALHALVEAGLVEEQQNTFGTTTYMARK